MLILSFCEKSKIEFEYCKNGKIKTEYNIVDGKRHSSFHYDSNTNYLSSERYYRNDSVIKYIDYFESGKIERRGEFLKTGHFRSIRYFKTGQIHVSTIFDREGIILNEEKYYENGVRDSIPYPYVFIKDIKVGMKASIIARFINMKQGAVLKFEAGDLVIGYDTVKLTGTTIIKDTIAVISASKSFTYQHEFDPKQVGENSVHCQISLKENRGDTSDIFVFLVTKSFMVFE